MWNDMWVMGIPVLDKGIRTVTVYLFITLALRLVGRRDLAQFTTFDLVVVLLLSNVVQNAIIGPDNSLTGGLVGAAMLFAINSLLVRIGTATDTAERIFEGAPTTIAENGELKHQVLRRLGVRPRDVEAALRDQGAKSIADVERAELMPSGSLLVDLRVDAGVATHGDIQELLRRMTALEAAVSRRS
jgi:uncharacterized membrane protein YcaP (DUF421 family)